MENRQSRRQTDPRAWRGIFTIPQTPFDDDGELDLDGLRRTVEFSVECGAHGIVHPVMASEFFTLSDAERLAMIPIVVRQTAGRCPVVIGVSGVCTQSAVTFARAAQEAGADAVIAMPPYVQKYSTDGVMQYFAAIDAVVDVPIFIQNAGLAAQNRDVVLRLAREIEHVHFIKEEVPPALQNISGVVEAREPNIWGVFGGHGGADLFSELRRGAAGNMPACMFTDILVRMFDLYDSGRADEGEALHRRLMPLINRAGPAKEVLVKRGVIRSARTRAAIGGAFDEHSRRERDQFWPELAAAFSWHAS